MNKTSGCATLHKDNIDSFYEHLNRQNVDIQLTTKIEENGKTFV